MAGKPRTNCAIAATCNRIRPLRWIESKLWLGDPSLIQVYINLIAPSVMLKRKPLIDEQFGLVYLQDVSVLSDPSNDSP